MLVNTNIRIILLNAVSYKILYNFLLLTLTGDIFRYIIRIYTDVFLGEFNKIDWGMEAVAVKAKKILISMSDTLLDEIDDFLKTSEYSRSEFIRIAMKEYMVGKRRSVIRQQLEEGYALMGDINLALAEGYVIADNEACLAYEEKLLESEYIT